MSDHPAASSTADEPSSTVAIDVKECYANVTISVGCMTMHFPIPIGSAKRLGDSIAPDAKKFRLLHPAEAGIQVTAELDENVMYMEISSGEETTTTTFPARVFTDMVAAFKSLQPDEYFVSVLSYSTETYVSIEASGSQTRYRIPAGHVADLREQLIFAKTGLPATKSFELVPVAEGHLRVGVQWVDDKVYFTTHVNSGLSITTDYPAGVYHQIVNGITRAQKQ